VKKISWRQKPTTICMKSQNLGQEKRQNRKAPGEEEKISWRQKPKPLVSTSIRSWENKKDRNWGEELEAPGEEIRISWPENPSTPVSPKTRVTHGTSFQIKMRRREQKRLPFEVYINKIGPFSLVQNIAKAFKIGYWQYGAM